MTPEILATQIWDRIVQDGVTWPEAFVLFGLGLFILALVFLFLLAMGGGDD